MNDLATRLSNVHNHNQGKNKRVLFICSAGMLRSATAAYALSNAPYNYNTRAVGITGYALIPLDIVLLEWADEIVCMHEEHKFFLDYFLTENKIIIDYQKLICLDIPDIYQYRNPTLIKLIKKQYKAALNERKPRPSKRSKN